MLDSAFVTDCLVSAGVTLISGVPCSSIGGLITAAARHPKLRYIAAANEGDAVAIASGAWLAGGKGAVLLQNSGLGNAVNPLTSLIEPFGIPLILYVGWRGQPSKADEPQHRMMGAISESMLRLCGFHVEVIDARSAGSSQHAAAISKHERLAFLIGGKGLSAHDEHCSRAVPVHPVESRDWRKHDERPLRSELLKALLASGPTEAAIVATTGKCSRELFEIEDRPQHFYQVGSMGCASSIALGFAVESRRPVVVIDGDGAALMRLGALATIGAERPTHFVHVLVDNEAHESTGGQPTASMTADLAAIAGNCGYRGTADCDDLEGFSNALAWSSRIEGPVFIRVKVRPGSSGALGRPTISPVDVARRFRSHFGMVS